MTPILTPGLTTVLLRTQSDERLLSLAARGHERAFAAIVDRYRPQLTRYLRRAVPAAPVDDAVQQTFVSAWTAIARGAEVRDLSAWLHRIARNAALAELKRPGQQDAELDDDAYLSEGPEAITERREDVRRALGVIADLPPRQRAALLAIAVEGRPSQDTATELGLTDTATRKLVSRARATLRAAATAITPPPLLTWLLQATHAASAAEGVAGAALTAGGAATLAKVGAAVTAVGIAASAPVAIQARAGAERAPATVTAQARAATAAVAATSARHPAAGAPAHTRRAATRRAGAPAVMRTSGVAVRVVGISRDATVTASAAERPTAAPTQPPATTTTAAPAPPPATASAATAAKLAALWFWRQRLRTRNRPPRPQRPAASSTPTTTTRPTYTRHTYTRPTYTRPTQTRPTYTRPTSTQPPTTTAPTATTPTTTTPAIETMSATTDPAITPAG